MPPKSKSPKPATKDTMEELQQELLDKINYLTGKFETLEAALLKMTKEKDTLKDTVQQQAVEIQELRNNLNEREQYARNWSMRILNVKVPADSENDTRLVMQCAYSSLIQPILEGARAAGTIDSVPSCDQLLETAHILPGKAGAKPIIARFFSRYWRNLVFRNRKEFAPRENPPAPNNNRSGQKGGARMKFPFFEDLTRATFQKLGDIKKQESVVSAWTVNGSIRFRVKDDTNTYKVSYLTEEFDDIVS